jgi:hypothetical protein
MTLRIRLLIKKKESILLVNYKFGRTYGEEFEVLSIIFVI